LVEVVNVNYANARGSRFEKKNQEVIDKGREKRKKTGHNEIVKATNTKYQSTTYGKGKEAVKNPSK